MSFKNNLSAGLSWSAYFFENSKEKERLEEFFNDVKTVASNEEDIKKIGRLIFGCEWDYECEEHETYEKSLKSTILELVFEIGLAKDVLFDEYEKALNLYNRQDFKSGLIKRLISIFYRLTCYSSSEKLNSLKTYLKIRFNTHEHRYRYEAIKRKYAEEIEILKNVISGAELCVFDDCGFAEPVILNNEVNEYIKTKYSYDFQKSFPVLQKIYIENEDSKQYTKSDEYLYYAFNSNAKEIKLNVIALINNVYEARNITVAKKLVDYIISNLKRVKHGEKILSKLLPFECVEIDRIVKERAKRKFQNYFARFGKSKEISDDIVALLEFPACENVNNDIFNESITIFDEFINEQFPTAGKNKEDFIGIVTHAIDNTQKNNATEFEKRLSKCWLYDYYGVETDAIEAICPDYFKVESYVKRILLLSYVANEVADSKDECAQMLHEILYTPLIMYADEYGYKTLYQRDDTKRNEIYKELCDILKSLGVTPNKNKDKYITALLDRKVATIKEDKEFPELEMYGDAIYSISVSELLFFNPDFEGEGYSEYNKYISHKSQIEVSKKFGFDKLYFSVTTDKDGLRCHSEIMTNNGDRREKESYLADSLEMIIGTVAIDLGYEKAIEFAKTLLKKAYPDVFTREVRISDFDDTTDEYPSWYINKIMPAPFENKYNRYDGSIENSLLKLIFCTALGTDEEKRRAFVTRVHMHNYLHRINSRLLEKIKYSYFHTGLKKTLDKYNPIIIEKYLSLDENEREGF